MMTNVDEASEWRTLWLIRHAQTAFNENGSFMGGTDVNCSEEGLRAARALRRRMVDLLPARIYSSPLSRATASAKALFGESTQVIVDSRLTERQLGVWEGRRKDDVRRSFPEAFKNGTLDPMFTPPGGERLDHFVARISSFLNNLSTAPDKTILVTHNGVIRVIRCLLEGEALAAVFRNWEPHLEPLEIRTSGIALRALVSSVSQ
jgi:phosphoserine phosphatase